MGKPVAAVYSQDGWRARTNVPDPSGINAAFDGGDVAVNTDWTQDTDTLFRVRIRIKQTDTAANTDTVTEFLLQYNNGGGGWNTVGAVGGDVEDIQYIAATGFANHDNTTQLDPWSGGGTFVTGDGLEAAGATDTVTFTDEAATETELEFALEIVGSQVADANTIDLRLLYSVSDASPPATALTETALPTITVNLIVPDVPKSDSDTGTLADAGPWPIVLSDQLDAFTLAESADISIPKSGDDTGTLAESVDPPATVVAEDTGTLAETPSSTITIVADDTGTFKEERTEVSIADTPGDFATFSESTELDQGTVAKAGTDTGTLAESVVLTVTLVASDTGTLDDAAAISAVLVADDVGTLADNGVAAPTADKAGTDSATFADDAFFTSAGDDGETGTLDDVAAITAVLVDSDTATLAEGTELDTGAVEKSGADTATLADDATISAVLVDDDTATLADNGVVVSSIASITDSDAFTLTDSGDASKTTVGAPPAPPSGFGGAVLPTRPLPPRRRRIRPKQVSIEAGDAFQFEEATRKRITPIEAGMMSRILRDRAAQVLQDARESDIFTQVPEPVALSWGGEALVPQPGPAVLEAEEDELIVLLIKSGFLN